MFLMAAPMAVQGSAWMAACGTSHQISQGQRGQAVRSPLDLLCWCFRGACGLEYSPGQRLEGRLDTRLLRLESVAGWLQRAPDGQSDPQR